MTATNKSATTSDTGFPHYVSLDSLRGICACAVVFYHMPTTGSIRTLPFFENSWLFVDFFFVLSGFVIAASYGDRLSRGFSISRFMALRLGRVYPLHLAVILGFLAMELAAMAIGRAPGARMPFTDTRTISSLVTNVTLTQIFGLDNRVTWNSPSWSIAAEVWTYLIAAVGLATLRGRITYALWATVIAMPIVLALVGDQGLDRTYSMALPRCLYGFALGMIVFDIRRRLRTHRYGVIGSTIAELMAVVGTIAVVTLAPNGRLDLLIPPLFALVIFIFASDAGMVSKALSIRPARKIGALSYSIYMVHVFVMGRFMDAAGLVGGKLGMKVTTTIFMQGGMTKALTGPGAMPDVWALVCLCTIVAVAWITYEWIEIPFRDMSRRWAKRIGARPEVPAVGVAMRTTDAIG